jgi:hypothetical protein
MWLYRPNRLSTKDGIRGQIKATTVIGLARPYGLADL